MCRSIAVMINTRQGLQSQRLERSVAIMEEKKDNSNGVKVTKKAEDLKTLGNKAFEAKDYDQAITHYSEALLLDPDNHIYYSNRSACYGYKSQWEEAAADAKKCIEKSPDFLKGYYRLATAEVELKKYDEAIETIKAGLKKQPDNPELQKQLRIVKAKKASAAYSARQSTSSDIRMSMEELQDLQESMIQTSRELKEVKGRAAAVKGDQKRTQLTLKEVEEIAGETRLFRSLGKMFLLSEKPTVMKSLKLRLEEQEQKERDLDARQQYLEAKLSSQQGTLQEARNAAQGS